MIQAKKIKFLFQILCNSLAIGYFLFIISICQIKSAVLHYIIGISGNPLVR